VNERTVFLSDGSGIVVVHHLLGTKFYGVARQTKGCQKKGAGPDAQSILKLIITVQAPAGPGNDIIGHIDGVLNGR
jgi:hypothetical protein